MSADTIRVVVVDDDSLVRNALSGYVTRSSGMRLVGTCRNGRQALELLAGHGVDVVLMDVRMPEMDGIEVTRELRRTGSRVKILVLTTFDEDKLMLAALAAGANGFMLKDSALEAIQVANSGGHVISARPATRLAERYLPQEEWQGGEVGPHGLTGRERAVLRELCRAASNAEIAGSLGLSESTVKAHVSTIMDKLNCKSRLKAVIRAFELGLAEPPRGSEQDDEGGA